MNIYLPQDYITEGEEAKKIFDIGEFDLRHVEESAKELREGVTVTISSECNPLVDKDTFQG